MKRRTKVAAVGSAVVVAGLVGTGIAVASSDDDATETPITGTDLQKAEEAALEHTGGGRVTGTEVDDEESKYEVEVTMPDGSQVDVQLDEGFSVVSSDGDKENDG